MSKEYIFQTIIVFFLTILPILQQKKIYILKKRILNMNKIKRKFDKSMKVIETIVKSEAYKEARDNVENFKKKNK